MEDANDVTYLQETMFYYKTGQVHFYTEEQRPEYSLLPDQRSNIVCCQTKGVIFVLFLWSSNRLYSGRTGEVQVSSKFA